MDIFIYLSTAGTCTDHLQTCAILNMISDIWPTLSRIKTTAVVKCFHVFYMAEILNMVRKADVHKCHFDDVSLVHR